MDGWRRASTSCLSPPPQASSVSDVKILAGHPEPPPGRFPSNPHMPSPSAVLPLCARTSQDSSAWMPPEAMGGRSPRIPANCSETLEKSRLRINQRVMTNCTDLTKHGAVCAKALQSLWQVFVEHLPTRPLEAPLLQEREQRKTQAQQVIKKRR